MNRLILPFTIQQHADGIWTVSSYADHLQMTLHAILVPSPDFRQPLPWLLAVDSSLCYRPNHHPQSFRVDIYLHSHHCRQFVGLFVNTE